MLKISGEYVSDWEEGEVRTPAQIDLISGEIETPTVYAEGHHHFIRQFAVIEDAMYRIDDDAWDDKGVLRLHEEDLAVLRAHVSAMLSTMLSATPHAFTPAGRKP